MSKSKVFAAALFAAISLPLLASTANADTPWPTPSTQTTITDGDDDDTPWTP